MANHTCYPKTTQLTNTHTFHSHTHTPTPPFYTLNPDHAPNPHLPHTHTQVLDEGVFFVNELFPDSMGKQKYHATVDAIFGLHKAKQIKKMYPMESKDGREAFRYVHMCTHVYCDMSCS